MKHLGTMNLETPRLVLRKFSFSDSSAVYKNWANDSEVTKYLMWPTHKSVDDTINVLRDWVGQYDHLDFYLWAITLRENGDEPIGSIAVVDKDDRIGMAEIGYCIGRSWWNRGITSEALSAVIRYLFIEVGINRIESRHDPRNPHSGKVMAKCGMKYEGTMREADWNNQGICDSAIYSILQKEYQSTLPISIQPAQQQ